jgi:hypothetical protein
MDHYEDGPGRAGGAKTGASFRRSFPLRLAKSLRDAAGALARRDGVSLNYFIALAVAEKVSRLEHEAVALEEQAKQPTHTRPKEMNPGITPE